MPGHFVYIAVSDGLMTLTKEKFDRFAIKVGESRDPRIREYYLGGRDPVTGGWVRACCGFDDWTIVASRRLPDEGAAEDLEARFKAAFEALDDLVRGDPEWRRPLSGNGESDVVLLPADIFQACLNRLDVDVRDLLIAGRSKMFSAVRPGVDPEPPHPDEYEETWQREWAFYEQDAMAQAEENMARAEAQRESGSYYD